MRWFPSSTNLCFEILSWGCYKTLQKQISICLRYSSGRLQYSNGRPLEAVHAQILLRKVFAVCHAQDLQTKFAAKCLLRPSVWATKMDAACGAGVLLVLVGMSVSSLPLHLKPLRQ